MKAIDELLKVDRLGSFIILNYPAEEIKMGLIYRVGAGPSGLKFFFNTEVHRGLFTEAHRAFAMFTGFGGFGVCGTCLLRDTEGALRQAQGRLFGAACDGYKSSKEKK